MNNKLLLIFLFLVIIFGGWLWFNKPDETDTDQVSQVTNSPRLVADKGNEEPVVATSEQYQTYSKQAFDEAADKRRVYFFHAAWCPTCRTASQDLSQHVNQLPEDVVVFKTDYDSETALKQQFGVTYQHTFVQVDENGELVKIWNGGGVDGINRNLL